MFFISEFNRRPPTHGRVCHVINMETIDDAVDSLRGGLHAAQLAALLVAAPDVRNSIYDIIEAYEKVENAPPILHRVVIS